MSLNFCSADHHELIKSYLPFVKRVVGRIFKRYKRGGYSMENHDDITQNVLLKFPSIAENYQKYAHKVPFENFLAASIRHTVLDSLKSQIRREKHEQLFPDEDRELNLLPSENDDAHDTRNSVRQAIGRLSNSHPLLAQITADYYFTGLQDPDIGALHGLTKIQAWRTRQAALHQLKNIIQK